MLLFLGGKGVYFFEKFSHFFGFIYPPYRGCGGVYYTSSRQIIKILEEIDFGKNQEQVDIHYKWTAPIHHYRPDFRSKQFEYWRWKERWNPNRFKERLWYLQVLDIDIKGNTDGKGTLQIKQDIEYEHIGDRFHSLEIREIDQAMDQFSIVSAQSIEDYATTIIVRHLVEDLMKREKYKNLTFYQKLYIYSCFKEREQVNQIL